MPRPPARERLIELARRLLPRSTRDRVVRAQRELGLVWPPVGGVRFGSLRRVTPISPAFGLDRGQPIDRYYIERFLAAHAGDLAGRGLEFGDTTYLDRFGGDRLTRKDVLSYVESPGATLVGDLTGPEPLAAEAFDCIVCTQTLQMIYDIELAVRRLHGMLRPGGVLLATTHGLSKVGRYLGRDGWGEYWHPTRQGVTTLFERNFDGEVEVTGYGNVLAAVASLEGLATRDLAPEELDYPDRDYDVLIGVRARRRAAVT